jgi:hypothetical protein
MTDAELRTWTVDWAPHPASDAVVALLDRIAAADALHVRSEYTHNCVMCVHSHWPCPTKRALRGDP